MSDTASNQQNQLEAIVRQLNEELSWQLTDTQLQQYVSGLLRCLPDKPATNEQLRRLVARYHDQHRQVAALQDATDPHHGAAWQEMDSYVRRILWKQVNRSLPNLHDIIDEVTQRALDAIGKSLPTYCYAAKVTTWVHKIIINRYFNYLRDERILNPPLDIVAEDVQDITAPPIREADQSEQQVDAKTLEELVNMILLEHPNLLMHKVFWLSADGFKLAEIGQRIGRSTTRAHELLRQARSLIQADPRFQAWLQDTDDTNTEPPD
jgi:RNA polymerase sigma factor (sigma-70 family)